MNMDNKIAGAIGLIPAIGFIAMWLILMLVAQPDCLTSFQAAKQTAHYVLTQPDNFFFIASLASVLVCLICSVLIFTKQFHIQAMYTVLAHAILALFIYDLTLAISIAFPLLYFNKVKASA